MPLPKPNTKDLAEQKLFETRRKGMHTPKAYIQYVEVWACPDNDVSKKHLRNAGAFCGRTIYARETREAEIDARLGAPE